MSSHGKITAVPGHGEIGASLDKFPRPSASFGAVAQMIQTKQCNAPAKRVKSDDKRERTRRALIEVALRLIAEKGIEATSVLAVTSVLGISNGAFYYHFRNKDHLLEDVAHAVVESVVALIESVSRDDPAAQVARGPLIALRYYEAHPQMRTIMLRVVVDPDRAHDNLHNNLLDHLSRGRMVGRFGVADVDLCAAFCRALVAGALRQFTPGCDARLLARQASAHTLAMLGLPLWEAYRVVEQECERIDAENRG